MTTWVPVGLASDRHFGGALALQDIKPEHVLAAIAEFEQQGRAQFLKTYGFRESRDVFLVHGGNRYDSKAILGVAHKFAKGTALGPHDFSGGPPTIQTLEALKFTVERTKDVRPAGWVFQSTPDTYRMLAAMLAHEETTFLAGRSPDKIKPGDKALIWVSGKHAGGYAFGEVIRGAENEKELPHLLEYWVDKTGSDQPAMRVRIRVDRLLFLTPLLRSALQNHPVLSQLNVIRQPTGTVFAVSDEEWEELEAASHRPDPGWFREERMLVLDLLLNGTNGTAERKRLARLFDRTANAISLEAGIFEEFRTPGKGLGNGSKATQAVWKDYGEQPKLLRADSEAILEKLLAGGGLTAPRKIWKISPGQGAEHWEWCRTNGLIGVGWGHELGDVRSFGAAGKDALIDAYRAKVPEATKEEARDRMWTLWTVLHDIRPGDVVVANKGMSELVGRGRVTGTYRHVAGELPHVVPVEWFDVDPKAIPKETGWFRSLLEISEKKYRELFPEAPTVTDPILKENADLPANIFEFLKKKKLRFPRELVTSYLLSLKTKPFVILSGISGTGKTKLAQAVAEWAGREERVVATAPPPLPAADVWQYLLKPYTLTHRKILVAREAEDLFLLPKEGSGPIEIHYGEAKYDGTFGKVMSKGRELYELRLGVALTDRLRTELEVGNLLNITVNRMMDNQGVVTIARVAAPAATKTETSYRHTFIAVRPDWLDRKGLIGFYNLLSEDFVAGPFLERALKAFADEKAGLPHFVTLDEMNLARVEHYFADVLSLTESRQLGADSAVTQEPLELHGQPQCLPLDEMPVRPAICTGCNASNEKQRLCLLKPDGIRMVPPKLELPTNLFITGTVNVDETTHMFSPKVLDRANVLEFNTVHLGKPPPDTSTFVLKDEGLALGNTLPASWADFEALPAPANATLTELHTLLEPFHLHFGYRVANEIGQWLKHSGAAVGTSPAQTKAAVDLQVLQKILPKFHGSKQQIQRPLWALLLFSLGVSDPVELTDPNLSAIHSSLAGAAAGLKGTKGDVAIPAAARLPRSAAKLARMVRRLREQGFVSFIE